MASATAASSGSRFIMRARPLRFSTVSRPSLRTPGLRPTKSPPSCNKSSVASDQELLVSFPARDAALSRDLLEGSFSIHAALTHDLLHAPGKRYLLFRFRRGGMRWMAIRRADEQRNFSAWRTFSDGRNQIFDVPALKLLVTLVTSRAITAGRLPRISRASSSVSSRRWGASYSASVRVSA